MIEPFGQMRFDDQEIGGQVEIARRKERMVPDVQDFGAGLGRALAPPDLMHIRQNGERTDWKARAISDEQIARVGSPESRASIRRRHPTGTGTGGVGRKYRSRSKMLRMS